MNDYGHPNSYRSPRLLPHAAIQRSQTQSPGMWKCYLVYCVLMAIDYLSVATFGAILLAFPNKLAEDEFDSHQNIVWGGMLVAMGGLFLLLFAVAPFLPRSYIAWNYGLVTISIGLMSLCTWPFCAALLWFWVKRETRAFFRTL
jgi:hypothetical protein